jgi:predicted nucleic acid-binding Zn ribbon protein
MIDNPTKSQEQPESARALSRSPMIPSCPICGAGLTGRKRACSARCRAALSRRRKVETLAIRERRMRELVKILAKEVGLRGEDFA